MRTPLLVGADGTRRTIANAMEEDDKGHLCVTAPGWDECVSFNPLKDWWVMYEKKSRKRSRDDDDGVDDNRRAVHPFETLVVVVVVAWVSCIVA